MKTKKINIENIPLSNVDINLIKDFIDLYEDIKDKIDEYNNLCDDIRTNIMIKEEISKNPETDLIELFDKVRMNLIKRISSSKNAEELSELNKNIKELQIQSKKLNQYDNILKIYNNTIYGRRFPSEYFDSKVEKNKYQYIKQQQSTITQVYRYVKYLYEICEKLYDYKPEKKSKSLLSVIKTKIKKLKLKRTIKKVKQDYIKDNEMNIAKIDNTLFIDIDSLEQNFEYYKMFEGPIFKFIMDNNEKIKKAVDETEKPIENEIVVSNFTEENKTEIIEVDRKGQIKKLKEVKEQLMGQEEIEKEIIVPTKTA